MTVRCTISALIALAASLGSILNPSLASAAPPSLGPASALAAANDTAWLTDPDYRNTNTVQRDAFDYRDVVPSTKIALAPGDSISQPTVDGKASERCTVGLLAELEGGARIAVTAGHCVQNNGQQVFAQRPHGEEVPIGRYRIWRADSDFGVENDASGFAVIDLMPNVRISAKTASYGTVSGTTMSREGQTVCKFGSTTAKTCGVTNFAGSRSMVLDLAADHGDSGGPVYVRQSDGTIKIVGIVLAGIDYTWGGVTTRHVIANPVGQLLNELEVVLGTAVEVVASK